MPDQTTPPPTPGGSRRATSRRSFLRRHPALTVLSALVLVLVLITGGWVFYLNHQLGEVTRFNADLDRSDRPAKVDNDAVNILLVGTDNDDRGDINEALSQTWKPGSMRTDTIMVLHINSDRDAAQLISIPRDSWVPIDSSYAKSTGGEAKINAAFSWGGPRLLVKTVEDFTGMRMDHVVMTGLDGFAGIATTVGGVDVYVPETTTDGYRGKTWTKGTHHLSGKEALLYVRQRKGLPNGDFSRIERQQNFLRATLDKVVSGGTMSNPIRITNLTNDLVQYVAVDDGFDPATMRDLAVGSRRLRSSDIRFTRVPLERYADKYGQSANIVDPDLVKRMFDAVAKDQFESFLGQNPDLEQLPAKNDVD